ncbi:MAG: hypothetical protein HXY40_05910 [Chloroflexi bacterium]|nr:hypothetical protein [Chloroflexota bacterium]
MRAYRPSGKVPFFGLLLLFVAGVVAAVLTGGLAFFISYQFNIFLVCIFPIFMGFIGGLFLSGAVKLGKVRNPLVATIFGLLTGILMVLVFRGAEYYFYWVWSDSQRIVERRNDNLTQEELNAAAFQISLERISLEEFIEFNQELAAAGTTITRSASTSSSSGIELDANMTWILWTIEALAIILICIVLPNGTASEPFNEVANRWFGGWTWLGSVPIDRRTEFLDLLQRGDFKSARQFITTAALPLPRVDLEVADGDSTPGIDMLLRVQDSKAGRSGTENSTILQSWIAPQDFAALTSK